MKKTVHIISHSHWDREWYMPYEQHHMRLIELLDGVIATFANDPDFKSFYLDGQTIPIDDYLQVRPEKKDILQQLIRDKKLRIGPFYILQDDFLISAESNTRNMLIGLEESNKWGEPVRLGYFPDTFGNMGQAPQMMKQGGMKAVAFGRGVKTTGFNNSVVDEEYASQYSEIMWEGADGTQILSILFANWYSNGNEIPTTEAEAREFWDQKLADVERYASTSHLLMMNGVDHQPVQKDVSQAIRLANRLYPDYEFIHSNFDDYITAVQQELPENIGSVKGELTSQETDGWYTLANTSSSRIYLKQANMEVQNLLERVVEPLATMASRVTGEYPHEMLRYAWKKLMQNHPHDSICGCGVDSVHRIMMSRFEEALEVGYFVRDEALRHLSAAIDTLQFPEGARPFTVFNTEGHIKTQTVTVEIEWERIPFNENKPNQNYQELVNRGTPHVIVIDEAGAEVPFDVVDSTVEFRYDLPKDAFRRPHTARLITLRLAMKDMKPFSWQTFALVEVASERWVDNPQTPNHVLENDLLRVTLGSKGQVDIFDKVHDMTYEDVLTYENVGDVGNEYIFKQSADMEAITSKGIPAELTLIEATPLFKSVAMKQTIMIPESADETLLLEQESVTDMRERQARRSQNLIALELITIITLEANSPILKFETCFNNQAKDHRLRALFKTELVTTTHEAESIYEVVVRPNEVSAVWQNPSNPQHQQSFAAITTQEQGMIVGNTGLHEYEILDNNTIALTLHRSVGEMGDWGYFPTPEAQCLGEQHVSFALTFHGSDDKHQKYQTMKEAQVGLVATQVGYHEGSLPTTKQFIEVRAPQAYVTSLKCREHSLDMMVRLFNLSGTKDASFTVNYEGQDLYESNLIETETDTIYDQMLKAGAIRTIRIPHVGI